MHQYNSGYTWWLWKGTHYLTQSVLYSYLEKPRKNTLLCAANIKVSVGTGCGVQVVSQTFKKTCGLVKLHLWHTVRGQAHANIWEYKATTELVYNTGRK